MIGDDGSEYGESVCAAGRIARFGGRWTDPCPTPPRHVLASDGLKEPLQFCDKHILQLIHAGLITDPFISEAKWRKDYLKEANGSEGKV